MEINATLINLYNVCKRELWLHANGIRFEHTSDLVYEGKLIHEDSYPQRSSKYEEIEMDGIKVDFYDCRKRSIPTHSERLNPPTIIAKMALKSA